MQENQIKMTGAAAKTLRMSAADTFHSVLRKNKNS